MNAHIINTCIIKGTHIVLFSSSFYIINQKPVINNFSLYNHMGCTFFWVKMDNPFANYVVLFFNIRWHYFQYKYLNKVKVYFDCNTILCLHRQGKYTFT